MVRIRIRAIGKIKEPYLQDAIDDYYKRIQTFSQIDITEYPESFVGSSNPGGLKSIISEGEKLCNSLPGDAYVIVLDPGGKELSSETFAKILQKCEVEGPYMIIFLIGGPMGISEACKKRADIVISLSKLTFPHQLARLILFEQIYRAFAINRGLPYHR